VIPIGKTGILQQNTEERGRGPGAFRVIQERGIAMSIFTNSRLTCRAGLILVIVLLFFAGAASVAAQTWNLVPSQSDEFNGPANSAVDSNKWHFDYGNLNVNNELEWYCGPAGDTHNAAPCDSTKPNVFIDGSGHLEFQAFRINTSLTNGSWTSSRMNTNGTMTFQYGRLEASMSLPVGPGLWPAFWALGSNFATVTWPGCGEMDFMENVPASGGLGPTKIRSTIHGPGYSGGNGLGQNFSFTTGDVTSFHTYGAIWSPNMVQFYVDNPSNVFFIRTANDVPGGSSQWVFNHPFINLTNLAVGGGFPGNPDSTTPSPATMLVDYIRYYQAAAVTKPTLGNPPSITVKAGATTGNSSTLTIGDTMGSGRVFLSCSTTAPKATCLIATGNTLNSNVIDFTSSATASATVTVTTTANSLVPPSLFDPRRILRFPVVIIAVVLLIVVATLALRLRRRVSSLVFATAGLLILAGMTIASCGGGYNMVTPPPPPPNGTTPGSYTVTVYAFTESNVSDGTNANADANVAIPLTVN
jgi:beta-glucanase (GH16 family)